MKLKKGFITHVTDGKQIMVSTDDNDFSGIVRSNDTAAFIVDCLKTETTRENIILSMSDVYDADRKELETGVDFVLEKLRSIGALNE